MYVAESLLSETFHSQFQISSARWTQFTAVAGCPLAQDVSQENRAIHYIPELDGLRGIAIILVVFWHARPEPAIWFTPLPFLSTMLEIGPSGVDLFFVLSGFLITSILLSTRDATPRSYFWSFYARRTLRIFPLYILAVAGFFYVALPYLQTHGEALDASRSEQIWYWTYLVNWHDAAGHMIGNVGHLWSLAVEEQFYLIWPAVVFFCAARYLPALCVGVGAFSLTLRLILSSGNFVAPGLLHEFIHRTTVTRLDTLAVGALIAVVVRNPGWTQLLRHQIKLIGPAAFGAYLVMWMASEQGKPFLVETLGYLAIAIACGCVVFVCVTDQGSKHPVCRVARWRPLRSIGRYSYAMYVLQIFAIWWLKRLLVFIVPRLSLVHGIERVPALVFSAIAMGACLGTSYIVAFASWHLIEKHFLRLKKYFPYQAGMPVSGECETEASAEAALAD
jgi:peptidoglycan/LPS O-acetylase OafA/YrhL